MMRRFLESPVNIMVDKRVAERIIELEEENKKLKSDLSLVIKERDDNIKQNKKLSEKIGQLEEENRKLKAELEIYKKQYKHTMGEYYIDEDLYDLDC